MVYIVHGANIVQGIFPTRDDARALQVIEGGDILEKETVPSWAEPGCYISDTGALAIDPPTTDDARLKRAARAARRTLVSWEETLPEFSTSHSATHIDLVRDFYTHAHEGLYLITHASAYTAAQKIAFCDALASGAADATEPAEYLTVAGTIAETRQPTSPTVWVSPPALGVDAWTRVSLADAKTTSAGITALSGTIPDGALDTDAWISDLEV